jgi:hypothetical protein
MTIFEHDNSTVQEKVIHLWDWYEATNQIESNSKHFKN